MVSYFPEVNSLENLVNDYNANKENNDSCSYTNSMKIPWVPNIGPKIRKEFKKVNKPLLPHPPRTYKVSYVNKRSLYLIAILECTSWIVRTMVDILPNQRKKYSTRCINKTAYKITGSHPAPLNTPKSAINNSNEFPQEQSA